MTTKNKLNNRNGHDKQNKETRTQTKTDTRQMKMQDIHIKRENEQ